MCQSYHHLISVDFFGWKSNSCLYDRFPWFTEDNFFKHIKVESDTDEVCKVASQGTRYKLHEMVHCNTKTPQR